MSDWSFIDKFGKDVAKHTGTITRSFWLAVMTGCVSGASLGDPKDTFDEEDMHGFSEKTKNWFREHRVEIKLLLACIAVSLMAASLAPVLWYSSGLDLVLLVLKLVSTLAAAIQSALGPIPAKSAFAILQSAGMGGHGLIIVKMIAAGGVFMGICPAVAASLLKAMKEEKCKHGDDEQTE